MLHITRQHESKLETSAINPIDKKIPRVFAQIVYIIFKGTGDKIKNLEEQEIIWEQYIQYFKN